jgi:hypothetical protein
MIKFFITPFLLLLSCTLVAAEGKWDGEYGSADQACRAKTEDSASAYQYSHAEVKGDIAHCYTKPRDSENKSPPDYVTAVFFVEAPEPNETSEDEKQVGSDSSTPVSSPKGASSSPIDICQQVVTTFNETLANELPPNKTNGATIAVGAITIDGVIQSWVAAASSIIGTDGKFVVFESGKPSTSKYDYYAQGVRINEVSNVRACNTNKLFVYPVNPARPLQGHAESKIIEDWFKGGAASHSILYLKIGGAQTQPCASCGSLIQFVNNGSANCPKIKLCP